MISAFLKWIGGPRDTRTALQRGFDWADERLQAGEDTEHIAALSDGAIDRTDFDRGAQIRLCGGPRPGAA